MIAIIDYNAGNATSLSNVLTNMGYECEITADSDKINSAEKVVFPGVGEASLRCDVLNLRYSPLLLTPFVNTTILATTLVPDMCDTS